MKPFSVFMNGECVGELDGNSQESAKRWVRKNVYDTHVGEWRKIPEGYEYNTTIGRYYTFAAEPTKQVLNDRHFNGVE
jgi:hypothetical protein